MDLNYLFHRHQFSLSAATTAASREARLVHRKLAAGYAGRIAVARARTGGTIMPVARVS